MESRLRWPYLFQSRGRGLASPITNDKGIFVEPSTSNIGDGSYNPLSRNIYMNVLNDVESLEHTRDFVRFGLSTPELLSVTGYVAPSLDVTVDLLDRMELAPYGENAQRAGPPVGLIWGLVAAFVAIIVGSAVFAEARYRMQRRRNAEERHEKTAVKVDNDYDVSQKESQNRATKTVFTSAEEEI